MLNITRISVPTPYTVGPVNSYLIKNRPFTLVDPGPDTDEAKKALVKGLYSFGVSLAEIDRVVITHSHTDHSGLARWIGDAAGAAVYVHKLEVRKLQPDYDYYQERMPFFKEAGMPESLLTEIMDDKDPVAKPLLPSSNVIEVSGGESLEFEGGALEILHLPGHSGGHVCLYDRQGGRFLSGDFILAHITPNPVMEADHSDFSSRIPALAQYLEGLDRLKAIDLSVILPGHGNIIEKCPETVLKAQKHHFMRLENICSVLAGGSLSVYQVMRVLYPSISGFKAYLGISEVFAHLDLLVDMNRVTRVKVSGVSFYSVVD